MAIRAVVVEEDPFLLEAVCDFLEGCGVDVVVRAPNSSAAIRAIAFSHPDVVLLGSGAADGCGPDPEQTITDSFPGVAVVALAVPGHGAPRMGGAANGAKPIHLDGDPRELIQAVRQVGAKAQYRLTWS